MYGIRYTVLSVVNLLYPHPRYKRIFEEISVGFLKEHEGMSNIKKDYFINGLGKDMMAAKAAVSNSAAPSTDCSLRDQQV